jgi:hypothetical protein
MIERGEVQVTPIECREKDETVTPIGDFIAQVSAAIAAILVFLTYYTDPATGRIVKGYETAYGIIILIVAALTFGFATTVLWTKFVKSDFWLARSPGWAYGSGAALIIIVSVLALAFPYSGYNTNWGVLALELILGAAIAVGAMFKFF